MSSGSRVGVTTMGLNCSGLSNNIITGKEGGYY